MQPPTTNTTLSKSATASTNKAARTTSQALLQGKQRLMIEHAGEEYCLRLTRNDKLILTKN